MFNNMGYGYYSEEYLTIEDVLKRYSQEEIIKIVMGEYPEYGKRYLSPFRIDNNPDCFFEKTEKGVILFVDWADSTINRDCFELIKERYGLSLYDALNFIIRYFQNSDIIVNIQPNDIVHKEFKKKRYNHPILYKPRNFNKYDYNFWNPYGITFEQLKEDKVIPITRYKYYSNKHNQFYDTFCKTNEPAYIYTEFPSKHRKVYRPMNKTLLRWMTDCSPNDIGNYKNLPIVGKQLVITKSYKDCRVLRNYGLTSIWFQNEGMFPQDWFFKDIIPRFNDIVIFFDNDEAGIKAATKLKEHFLTFGKKVRVVYSIFEQKDPADIRKYLGEQTLNKFLHEYIRKSTSNMVG